MQAALRPQQVSDLPYLTGGDSLYDDFGPRAVPMSPRPAALDADGALSVITEDGSVAGLVSWHWVQ